MSMTADRSRTDGARRLSPKEAPAAGPRQAASYKPPPHRACAHPMTLGALTTLSLAPFLLTPGGVTRETVLQPAALALGGWLGSEYGGTWSREHRAMARFVGAAFGAAAAAAVGHALHAVSQCNAGWASCWADTMLGSTAGACGALIGGAVGSTAWGGRHAPVADGPGALASTVMGAYALSGLGMASLNSAIAR